MNPRHRRCYWDGSDFKEARLIAGFTNRAAAELVQVSERTVRNWEAGRTSVPYAALELLRIRSGYALPGQAWRGFVLRGDSIYSPEGRRFSAYDLGYWGLTCAMAREFSERYAAESAPPASTRLVASKGSSARTARAARGGNPQGPRSGPAGAAGLSGHPQTVTKRRPSLPVVGLVDG